MSTYDRIELPVKFNGAEVKATITFADKNDDFSFVAEWKERLGDDQDPKRTDAVELALVTKHRFEAHSTIQPYVSSIRDIAHEIAADPMTEVAGIVLLKCEWFPDSKVIGISHFRRTWCNNLILDYLAVHPFIANSEGYPHKVKGAGTALIYFVSRIAQQHSCKLLWGEATQGSHEFYKNAFKLDSVDDLIFVPREKFIQFVDGLELGWEKKGDTATTKAVVVEEVYKAEEMSTPLAGSRTAMFSPERRLASHFWGLQRHVQREIAESLGLLEPEDEGLGEAELFRRIFRRASNRKLLADLWKHVEEKHPQGEPESNPFVTS